MSDDNKITNASILMVLTGSLFAILKIIHIRFIKKEVFDKPKTKELTKNVLLVSCSAFIGYYIMDTITPTLLTIEKPGVLISEPEF